MGRKIKLYPAIKTLSPITIEKMPLTECQSIWETDGPLFWLLDSPNSGILVDLKLMQNLARKLDYLINKEVAK